MLCFLFSLSFCVSSQKKPDPNYGNADGDLLSVPSSLTKYSIHRTIKTIGPNCFENSSKTITSINFKDAIMLMRIMPYAFKGCIKLTSIDFSNCNLLWSIQESAFENSGIETIILPNSLKSLGDYAFSKTKITNLTIPDSLFWIGKECFYKTPLETVEFVKSPCLAVIGTRAFAKTKLNSFFIPKKVGTIGGGCFSKTNIENITLSSGNIHLSYNITMYNKNKTRLLFIAPEFNGTITLHPNVREISENACEYCKLSEIDLQNVKVIGKRAFYNSMLTKVVIPASVKFIGESAFEKCSKLNSLEVKSNDITISTNAFYHTGIICNVKSDPSVISALVSNGISLNSFYKCEHNEYM